MFTVEIEGLEEVDAEWQAALADVARGMTAGVERGVREAAEQARSTHPYQDRTGKLTASISGALVSSATPTAGGEAVGVLTAKEPYASFVEAGTAPHEINARRAPVLRWETPDGPRFARTVQHPGTRQQPYMGPAVQKAERVVTADVEAAVERAAERFR